MEGESGIGPYRIDAEIARSSICTIYRAWETSLNRPVLVKKLHPQMNREEDIRKRFEREAQVCARVKHENIVDIYSYRADEEATLLAMEFVEGTSLGDMIAKRGRIEWRVALTMLAGVLKGLAYAHSKGVTHRDIKPDNLLVSDEGRVKITDFGLATIADSSKMTVQGAVVGTPAYLPPEQVSGGVSDHRGDLYSTGVAFYEAATGVSPFSGQTLSDTLKKILNSNPPPPSSLIAEIPVEYDQIIARLLEKQPSKRYATADQALEDVKRLATQKGINLESAAVKSAMEASSGGEKLSSAILPVKTSISSVWWKRVAVIAAGVAALAALFLAPVPRGESLVGGVSGKFISAVKGAVSAGSLRRAAEPPPTGVAELPAADRIPSTLPPDVKKTAPILRTEVPHGEEKLSTATGGIRSDLPGKLAISCRPWATVTIDNIPHGQTPLPGPIELSPGQHTVALTNSEFPISFAETVIIEPGVTASLDVDLWMLVGRINILSVKPWAEVYVDGVSYGMTPRAKPILVPFGRRVIELRNPAYKLWSLTVTLDQATQSVDVTAELEKP